MSGYIMKKKCLVGILILFLFSVVAIAEAKPSRPVEKKVFIHRAKGGKPGKPDKPGGAEDKLWYSYGGVHWADDKLPITYIVDYDLTYGLIGEVTAGVRDGVNGISYGDYPSAGAIAVTYIWYYGDTGEVIEVDTLFDTDYAWSTSGEPDKMDLQNIATHEFGHWLVLDDLYMKPARRQTMYGYSGYGETIKITLENGDIAGIEEIYGP
jgi:hypothetical protein